MKASRTHSYAAVNSIVMCFSEGLHHVLVHRQPDAVVVAVVNDDFLIVVVSALVASDCSAL